MNTSQDIRTLFLEEFVKRMIIKSLQRAPQLTKRDGLLDKMEKISKTLPVLKIKTRIEETPPHLTKEFLGGEIAVKAQPLIQKVVKVLALPVQVAPPAISIMERLRIFITDSTVSMINCSGPGKRIAITRFGISQPTAIVLNREEIKNFLKELSDKTRIPLLPGIFKVVYQNLIVTAVVSDYIGSKFIIEKKPATLPPLPRQPIQPLRFQFR